MAGLDVTTDDINLTIGTLGSQMNDVFTRIKQLQSYLDAKSVSDLETMGFSADDANLIKSAIADMGTIVDVARGDTDHTPASDLTVFPSRVWGIGVTKLIG